jgi:HEAT repeat protein
MTSLDNIEQARKVDFVLAELLSVAERQGPADVAQHDVRAMVAAQDIRGLWNLLGSEDWRERVRAIRGLGVIGDARVIEPLIRSLMDDDERVRQEAALILGSIEKRMEKVYFAR